MANTFLRKLADLTDSAATVYTVPASTTTVVIGCVISNTTASQILVEIEAAGKIFGTDIPIPAGSSLSPIDGKLVLETTDTFKVTADTASSGAIILSIMEMT